MANRLGTNDIPYDASRLNTLRMTADSTSSGGGTSGAPLGAPYVTVGGDATLTNERALTEGAYIDITDGGANSTVTVALDITTLDTHNDGRFLKLDASNDPLTGALDIIVDNANALRVMTEATPSWTFPSAPILDNFNRGDEGPPPSANWSNPSGVDGLRVYSVTCATPQENSATAYSIWLPLSTMTDGECYATTVNTSSTIGDFYFFVRVQDPNDPLENCYALHVHYDPTPGNSYSEFIFNLAGAPSTNNQSFLDWNLGDQWGVLVENNLTDVVLTAYRNGTAENTWTDASSSGFAIGYIGLGISGDDSDPLAYNALDFFGGGAKVGSLTQQTIFNVDTINKITTSERFESTVLNGLSPFVVSSRTVVTNLNADLLDGQHAAAFAPAAHDVLSATHGDALTASVVRGDVIIGNATPKWARLALGGITGSVITRTATDVGWSAGALTFGGAFTLTISGNSTINGSLVGSITGGGTLDFVAASDSLTVSGDVGFGPSAFFGNDLFLQDITNSTIFRLEIGKTLTVNNTLTFSGTDSSALTLTTSLTNQGAAGVLNWAGAYTLTVPATGTALLRDANIAATRIAFGSDANTLTASAGLTYASDLLVLKGQSASPNVTYWNTGDVSERFRMGISGAGEFQFQGVIAGRSFYLVSSGGAQSFSTAFDTGNTIIGGTLQSGVATHTGTASVMLTLNTSNASNFINLNESGTRNWAFGHDGGLATNAFFVYDSLAAKTPFKIWPASVENTLSLYQGLVGIGKATPTAKIDVLGATDILQLSVIGHTTQTLTVASIARADTAGTGVRPVLSLDFSGSGADNNGGSIPLLGRTTTTAASAIARLAWSLPTGTDASYKGRFAWYASDKGGEREVIRGEASGASPMLSFYGGAAVVRGAALTTQLATITHTAPGTPDYAIQDLIDSSAGAAFGFATKDEGNSVLAVIANLQARVAELEARLGSATGVNLFA